MNTLKKEQLGSSETNLSPVITMHVEMTLEHRKYYNAYFY